MGAAKNEPTTAPRTVKPRQRKAKVLPVIAVYKSDVLSEGGELTTFDQLVKSLPSLPPTIFSVMGSAQFLTELDRVYKTKHPNSWQWRTSEYERDIVRPDGEKVAAKCSVVVHYFGWKNGNYHKVIDCMTMYGHPLSKIWPEDENPIRQDGTLLRLLQWGTQVRNFCRDAEIDVRPTVGGISAQFMTDTRFYPSKRRKVPAKINQRAREELPGNHYVLNAEDDNETEYEAYYLDQRRAHHYHAKTLHFPSSNTLYAYGSFRELKSVQFQLDEVYPHLLGLYCVDLLRTRRQEPFGWVPRTIVQQKVFVWSNELQHLLDSGYQVTGVRAAWGSIHRDEGLNHYGQWAEERLDRYGDEAWLKPLLLSGYGTLAIRPKYAESVFRIAKTGEDVTFRTGKHSLSGKLVKSTRKLEPGIANVLHRGMIEAATRSESVGLAQYLSAMGHNILSIYADAVMVECDDELTLPMLPEPWRNKRTLHHLRFINRQAFTSGEMTKLPGVGREMLKHVLKPVVPQFNLIPGISLTSDGFGTMHG